MRFLLWFWWVLFCIPVPAHIGSPNVIFEGVAGQTPIRVIIRPPGVIPGLAEIDVRTFSDVQEVSVLPVFWETGHKGAPPPDKAEAVKGETNLSHAKLWLMSQGAYSVEVAVKSKTGVGTVSVPVNSIATARNVMPRWFGASLAVLGVILFASAVRLAGAAFGESVLEPGALLTRKQKLLSWGAAAGAALIFSLLLLGGRQWWIQDDKEYRERRLYARPGLSFEIQDKKTQPVLRLKIAKGRRWKPLLPDHGKLMHLFLVKSGNAEAFAHLHPVQSEAMVFDTAIPPVPGGQYHAYADITHEDGTSETLTTLVLLPEPSPAYRALWVSANPTDVVCSPKWMLKQTNGLALPPDPDDSWLIGLPGNAPLPEGHSVKDLALTTPKAGSESSLSFRLLSREHVPVPLEPYMGMLGHLVVWKKDGSVFSHVHPSGNFSIAAQHFFQNPISQRDGSAGTNKVNSTAMASNHTSMAAGTNRVFDISFPFEFPGAGQYRIWVQLKGHENVFTGVFDQTVAD